MSKVNNGEPGLVAESDLIKDFWLPSAMLYRHGPLLQQRLKAGLPSHPFELRYGLIGLNFISGRPIEHYNNDMLLCSPKVMEDVQQMFPDKHHFRVKVIDEAMYYESRHPEAVRGSMSCVFRSTEYS